MTYFKNVNTLEELRKQYKELLKKYHPDNKEGSTEKTQEINSEYDKLFKILKDKHEKTTTDSNKDKTTYDNVKYDFTADQKLREVLQQIISFEGITIEIVGCWIWLDGKTYQYKEALKTIGFKWSGQRKKWYWNNGEYRKRGNSKLSMDDIRSYYGSTTVETEQTLKLKQA